MTGLGTWVDRQRVQYKENRLPGDRAARLNEIDFVWSREPPDKLWEKNFQELTLYREKHGHCRVPQKESLGKWVNWQRKTFKKNGCLPGDRVARMDDIGFDWGKGRMDWEEQFQVLTKYKESTGHCNVPRSYDPDPSLGMWVRAQRTQYKRNNGKLPGDRVARLVNIGFTFNSYDTTWDEHFQELTKYHQQKGDSNVPSCYEDNRSLASWVQNQRTLYKKGKLPDERVERLASVGFKWDLTPDAVSWERRFCQLEEYKSRTGHCRVPLNSEVDRALGLWASKQRHRHKKGKLSDDHFRRLTDMEFEWVIHKAKTSPKKDKKPKSAEEKSAHTERRATPHRRAKRGGNDTSASAKKAGGNKKARGRARGGGRTTKKNSRCSAKNQAIVEGSATAKETIPHARKQRDDDNLSVSPKDMGAEKDGTECSKVPLDKKLQKGTTLTAAPVANAIEQGGNSIETSVEEKEVKKEETPTIKQSKAGSDGAECSRVPFDKEAR